jgi:hypothetical protein
MQQNGFYCKLIVRSACFGHHYAHHQELKGYTDGCCLWYKTLWFTGRWSDVRPGCGMLLALCTTGSNHLYKS